jgi:dolichol-phosphate mannosyltransferase
MADTAVRSRPSDVAAAASVAPLIDEHPPHIGVRGFPWPCELTIVLPTYNEVENIAPLLLRLEEALDGIAWEAVFVDDDSDDGTASAVRQAAARHPNVRLIRRIGRRGLSSAVVEGTLSSLAPYIAVMDADMQHDETILRAMLDELRTGTCDLVVGSRYVSDGGVGDWSTKRQRISRLATQAAHMFTGVKLSDPMSGFFMITQEAFDGAVRRLSGEGFKILLDIAASSERPLRVVEKPYQFRSRQFGRSKLDTLVAIEYLMLLLSKLVGGAVPVRFLIFGAVGALGLIFHMAVLSTAFEVARLPFAVSQALATSLAMAFNFFVNNTLTYRDRRLRGARQIIVGLVSFYAVCSLGAIANVGIANYVFANRYSWWLAGVAGVIVGAVWNYAATSVFTWRPRARRTRRVAA